MAGNPTGGKLAAQTNRAKYGADFYKRIGGKGGVARVPKGFAAMPREKRAAAGHKGGSISKRGKALA